MTLLLLLLLVDTLNHEESSLEPEHLAEPVLQSAGGARRSGRRSAGSTAQRVLQDLAALVSINVLDLVAIEASTTTAAYKLDSVQVGHAELNHCNCHQNGSAAQTGNAMDCNCRDWVGVLLLLARRGRSTAASDNASIYELQPVLDDIDRGHGTITEWPVVDGDALGLEGLCPVGGLAAADDVGDVVALQLLQVKGQGRVGRAIEDQKADALGHGRLDQGQLASQGGQSRAAGRGGQSLETGGRGVDGDGRARGLCRDGAEHADGGVGGSVGGDGAHCIRIRLGCCVVLL